MQDMQDYADCKEVMDSNGTLVDIGDIPTKPQKSLFADSNRLDNSPSLNEDMDKLLSVVKKLDKEAKFKDKLVLFVYPIFIFANIIPGILPVIAVGFFLFCIFSTFPNINKEINKIKGVTTDDTNRNKKKVEKREFSFANYPELTKRKQIAVLVRTLLQTFKNGYLKVNDGLDVDEFERVGLLLEGKEFSKYALSRKCEGSIWFGMKTDKIEFELSNMLVSYSVGSLRRTNFMGVLAKVHLNKAVTEDTIFIPRKSINHQKIGAWEFDEKVNVFTNNELFDNSYRVQSSTGTTAVMLNSSVLDTLLQMSKKYPNIGFATSGNELYIAWRTDDVFFPIELDKKGEIDRLTEFAKDVIRMKELFESNIDEFSYQ